MEKLKMHSPNLTDENIAKIRELFPDCVTEAKDENGKLRYAVDFDQLRQELSDHIVEGPQERYRLDWPGKREALLAANAPIAKTLRPCREESVDFDTTQNLFIEGDNLEALKLLQETYLGKVKMIYIDPPYNKDVDVVYLDDFAENNDSYLLKTNQKSSDNGRLVANPETDGKRHSKWLSMLFSRIKLMRSLLREDGLLFMSIDESEFANAKKICDEIFGGGNAVHSLIWPLPRGINAGHVSKAHEYILAYARDKESLPLFNNLGNAEFSVERCNKKIDRRHPASNIHFPAGIKCESKDKTISGVIEGSERVEIIDGAMVFKNGKLQNPVTLRAGWTMKNMILSWLKGEKVYDSKGQIIVDFFFKENGKLYSKKKIVFQSPKSVLSDVKDTQYARMELENLLESQDIFPYPKPTTLISRLIELVTTDGDIIADFFAGSCTTADAVMKLNSKDGKNRKYILSQLPEELDENDIDHIAAIEFCDEINVPRTISEIGKERIRRAGKQILEGECHEDWNKDVGFRILKIDSSNMADVYYTPGEVKQEDLLSAVDNIKPGRDNPEDLLFQVLVDWGVDLTLPIRSETIQEKTVFFVNEEPYDLIACFDTGITEEFVKKLAKYEPMRVVFRDNGFVSDAVKINADQIFRQLSLATDVKSI